VRQKLGAAHARAKKRTPLFRNSRALAGLYLLTIPTFALLFALKGADFRTSTIDARLTERQKSLEGRMSEDFANQLTGRAKLAKGIDVPSAIDFSFVRFSSGSEASLQIDIRTFEDVDTLHRETAESQRCDAYLVKDSRTRRVAKSSTNKRVIFDCRPRGSFQFFDDFCKVQSCHFESPTVSNLFESIGKESVGSIGHDGDRFGRTLYLSVSTITTLGPGDIVPTSLLTRVLVGSEALLGVVLVGLFLNSVALRAAERHPPLSADHRT
jgi:hypothetical protein